MPALTSRLSNTDDAFIRQRAEMLERVAAVRQIEAAIRGHGDTAAPRFAKRGQLLPRERVDRLLDAGSPFLELSALAGYRMHDDKGGDKALGGGTIVGIGLVRGVRAMIGASDSAVKGGSVTPMGLRKTLRAQEIALKQRLPFISLIESGGANLLYQSELFVDGGRVFANMARLSAAGIPQITVVHGSSTAGGAYIPGLSDYVIAVRGRARIFLAGPPLVKAAIGEDSDEEALGGADMHHSVSGTVEYVAEDDDHAVQLAREVLAQLDWNASLAPAARTDRPLPPRFDPEELCGVVPVDPKRPYDVREVLARLVDDSQWLEFKEGYGAETVCGHARVGGFAVGVLGNNGPIQPDGSVKAAQFIQLCCQASLPLVFLMNTTGYMVGTRAEQAGAIKHGSKMIQAVANATVPRITFILGGGYGAGNYGMSGRAYDPDFLFAWPTSRVAVMGGEQAAEVMKIITRSSHARKGLPLDESALDMMSGQIRDKLDKQADALFATARIWDDGVIDPRDTREVLMQCLHIVDQVRRRSLRPNTFGVARG